MPRQKPDMPNLNISSTLSESSSCVEFGVKVQFSQIWKEIAEGNWFGIIIYLFVS